RPHHHARVPARSARRHVGAPRHPARNRPAVGRTRPVPARPADPPLSEAEAHLMRVQINRGDTWEQDGLLEIATGTLAGCTIWLTVKRDPRDPDPGLAQISTDQGGVTI